MPRTNLRIPLALLAALTCLGLLGAAPAQGTPLEQVAHFGGVLTPPAEPGVFPEEEQLGGVGGMAVNYTGAGGVPAGTVYVATKSEMRIAMFKPVAGDLKFSLGWEVKSVEGSYKRCGPDLEPTPTECKPRAEAGQGFVDVDIDQSTGNVYVIDGESDPPNKAVAAYTPKGEEVLTRFGEKIAFGQTTAATPDKIHSSFQPGGIAVNEAGEVYLYDRNGLDNYDRLMKFVPKVPGVYDEYEYAGAAEDVAAGQETEPVQPVGDAAGNLYTTSMQGDVIKAYDPANPEDPPLCEYKPPKGGVTTITVNPLSGELYYFSHKKEANFSFKTVHQLDPCDPETGEFGDGKQVTQVEVTPERADLGGLAFDPLRKFSPSRGAGVLYGGAPSAEPSGTGKGEPGLGSLGYIFAPVEENPPAVKAQSVSHVTTTSALLQASIDPEGSPTRYVFQYITEAAYEANEPTERFAGAQEAPLGGAPLGEGSNAISAAAPIAGLSPDTDYRYRAVATSNCSPSDEEKVCEGSGEAQSFHTFAIETPELPDHRAYELVSPVQKNGGQVMPADPRIDSCIGKECKPGNLYTQFLRQSAPGGNAIAYEGTPFGSEGAPVENQYIAHRDAASGWQTTSLSPQQGGIYQAFDTELNQGVLGNGFALSPEAPPGYLNLYSQLTADPLAFLPLLAAQPPNRLAGNFQIDYAGASANLSRVFFEANDALSEETPFAPAAPDGGASKFNLYEWERATGQLRLVNVAPGNATTEPGASFGTSSAHAISADGSRAFWSDEAGQLYVREDGEVTREIPDPGKFLSASVDGSKVLLGNGHVYDLEAEENIDLSEGKGGFQGLVGQSDDLSRVYFVDTAVLDEAPNEEGDEAEAGKFNLYAWSEGSARFIATLLATDNTNVVLGADWHASPANRTAQASPDGRWVAFLSQARLTGYDNTGPCELVGVTQKYIDGPCQEVFLYDSQTDKLHCPSCNPSGSAPLGRSVLRLIAASSSPQLPYITDSGRLYFDSQDSLTPFDTNEGVEDVYEYEPNKVGTCKRPDGCVSLISPGSGVSDSNLLTIDESGRNVFFTTRDQLTLPDKDELIDLYVAREDGGIPSETAKTDSECQGEACQPAAFAPNDPTPGSASFEGPGNVKQGKAKPRCPKGRRQVRRKGKTRCVKRGAKRQSARTANRNRGGAK